MILALVLLHLIAGVAVLASGDRLGRRAFLVVAAVPAVVLFWLAAHWSGISDGRAVEQSVRWVDALDLALDLRVDGMSALMLVLVAGIGLLVCLYSWSYFGDDAPGTARLAGLICLFAGAMTGVVVSDHLLALFVFWELTSVTSYLLIGNSDRNAKARAAALQALLITGAGGLVMLFGFVLLGQALGTYRISEIVGGVEVVSGGWTTVAAMCILVGAFTKSAQMPFASWLPGAMVAPTPISAYLHSATMVKAGVYLIGRLSPALAGVDGWTSVVVTVGVVTMVGGGLRALRQNDLKLLLAHGTVSQLGFLVVLFGLGVPAVSQAAVVMILAHAVFKAALFMTVGIVDHELGTRDIRRIPGFDRAWTPLLTAAVLSAVSMAGIPPLLGFIGKEKALETLHEAGTTTATVALVGAAVGSVLTAAYSARFVLGLFGRRFVPSAKVDAEVSSHEPRHAPHREFYAPVVLLAAVSLVAGLLPGLVDPLVAMATESLVPGKEAAHLALWHGFTFALALSAVIIALGAVIVVADGFVQRVLSVGDRLPSTQHGYQWLLTGVTRVASRVTGWVQHGSLPLYSSVVLITIAVVPSVALLGSGAVPGIPDMFDSVLEIPLVGMALVAATGAAIVSRRFAAALLLGAVGYFMAGIYVLVGALDLALTQFAVETLSVVVFMLTLRHLPDKHESVTPRIIGVLRIAVAAVVASFVLLFATTAPELRTEAPVSDEFVERAYPEAKGQNVVNVIIVDFRGLDTLGEIGVLAVAAIGAIGLVRGDRFGRRTPRVTGGALVDQAEAT